MLYFRFYGHLRHQLPATFEDLLDEGGGAEANRYLFAVHIQTRCPFGQNFGNAFPKSVPIPANEFTFLVNAGPFAAVEPSADRLSVEMQNVMSSEEVTQLLLKFVQGQPQVSEKSKSAREYLPILQRRHGQR